jgi:hypothetical protein
VCVCVQLSLSLWEKESRLRREELHLHASALELSLNHKLSELEWNERKVSAAHSASEALAVRLQTVLNDLAEVEAQRGRLESDAARRLCAKWSVPDPSREREAARDKLALWEDPNAYGRSRALYRLHVFMCVTSSPLHRPHRRRAVWR